mmetsp:Transcript_12893/g.34327  ORF Transcript_12893/g.34327 Transcript_12893/m.34327 type:complete len:83 (-) Transcript_12893:760-1008(-)
MAAPWQRLSASYSITAFLRAHLLPPPKLAYNILQLLLHNLLPPTLADPPQQHSLPLQRHQGQQVGRRQLAGSSHQLLQLHLL